MKLSNRRLWIFGAIAIGAIILITLLAAPASNKLNSGSTYNRAPDGYGAWYAFMSERGTPVQRWRKPFEDLANNKDAKPPITLLRVYSNLTSPRLSQSLIEQELTEKERNWVESGNTLVILGVRLQKPRLVPGTQWKWAALRLTRNEGKRMLRKNS